MDHSTVVLKRTFETDEFAEHDRLTIPLKELFRDDYVEDARLIRYRHKGRSIRCAGLLLHDCESSRPNVLSRLPERIAATNHP
jgi:hypothetical protein